MTILMANHVLYYLKCLACGHRFHTKYRNKKCSRCSAVSIPYGVKLPDPTPVDPETRGEA